MNRIDLSILRASGEEGAATASGPEPRRTARAALSEDEIVRMERREVLHWIEQTEADVRYLETQLAVLERFPAYFSSHLLGQATHAQKEELSRMMDHYAGYYATLKTRLADARDGLARIGQLRDRLRDAPAG